MANFAGTSDDDVLDGTADGDNFDISQGGVDTISGARGDDTISASNGTGALFGGHGNDTFIIDGAYTAKGGADNDTFAIIEGVPLTPTTLQPGKGFDTLELGDVLDAAQFDPAAWGFEMLVLGLALAGTDGDDHWDFSGLQISGEPFIAGMGGNDRMIGADDHFNRFYGLAGNDRLFGGDATDEMTGGTGRNKLYGGGGDDNLANFEVLSDGAGHTLLDGGDGDDQLFANNGKYQVYGGAGADWIGFENTTIRQDTVFGGNGIDQLDLDFDGIVFDVDLFDAESTGIESLTGGEVIGSDRANTLDFSEFTLMTDAGVDMKGNGGDDVLTGTYSDDVLAGGADDDFLNGTAGHDALYGRHGNDALNGGLGQDQLTGGDGADTFAYLAVQESTGMDYDSIADFDATSGDTIDLPFSVNAVDPGIRLGSLSSESFDDDLAAAIGAGALGKHHAVLFRPDAGSLEGATFVIVDVNRIPGYQAGEDLVIQIDGRHITQLDVDAFS